MDSKATLKQRILMKAEQEREFYKKLEEISIMQTILSPGGPVSTMELVPVTKTPEWEKAHDHYRHLCKEVAEIVVTENEDVEIITNTLMLDLSIMLPIVEERQNRATRLMWQLRIGVAVIAGIIGFLATTNFLIAIGLAVIAAFALGNFKALFLPKHSNKQDLIGSIATVFAIDIVYAIMLFIPPIRDFLVRQGTLFFYSIPIVFGLLTLLAIIRGVQLRNDSI